MILRRVKFNLMLGLAFSLVLTAHIESHAEYRTTLQPSITVSQEHTDNVDQLPDGLEESEWITVISPSIALDVVGKTKGLNLSYTPGFTFYADRTDNNTVRQSGSLSAWSQLAKNLELTWDNAYSRTEEPYEVDTLPLSTEERRRLDRTDFTTREEREVHSSYTGNISLGYQFGKRDRTNLGYRFRRTWEESANSEDSTEHSPYFDLTYWLTPHWGTEYSLAYTRGEFSGETETFDEYTGSIRLIRNFTKFVDGFLQYSHTIFDRHDGGEDYQVYDPSVGVDWQFARDGRVSFSVGYYIKDNEDSDDDSDLSFSGDISKGFDISRRTSFRVTGGSGYEQSYFGAENLGFTVYYQARGRLTHAFTKRVDGDFSVGFRRNEYRDEEPEQEDDIWDFQAGLNWQVFQRVFLRLSDTYRIVDSNLEEEEYKENKVMLSLTYTPKPFLFK